MTELGQYRLLRVIGEGGMGVVHLADAPDGSQVAVKVLRDHVIGDAEARERLAREVDSLARVQSRWVAEIIDADPWGPTPYVVTRFVSGQSLYQSVSSHGPLVGDDLIWMARGLVEGISAVHNAGVLHRDIKPSNVLMEGLSPVLIDFGLARLTDDPRLTQAGWLLGTPGYLAPEILYGEEPTTAADVHAWAGTVAFAATGRPPFGRGPSMAIMDRTRRGEYDLDGVPPALRTVLETALSPEPRDRPSLDDLRNWLQASSSDPTGVFQLPTSAQTNAAAAAAQNQQSTVVMRSAPEVGSATADSAPPRAVPPAPPTAPVPPAPSGVAERTTHQPIETQFLPADAPVADPSRPSKTSKAEQSRRSVLWVLVLMVVAAGLAAWPWIGVAVVAALTWVLRTGSMAVGHWHDRRMQRGTRWYDRPALILAAPAHLVRSLGSTVILILWAAGMVVAAVLLAYAVAAPALLALLVSGAAFTTALLLGPGSAQLRSPISRAINPLSRTPKRWLIATLILVALVAVTSGLAARGADWSPYSEAPFSGLATQ